MIFDDVKRIFPENCELLIAVLPSEEDATSLSDSRFKLKELRQSSIGKKCFVGTELSLISWMSVANSQSGLGPESLFSFWKKLSSKRLE